MSDVFENKGALAATIVVAASNSLNKGQANYICDGVQDNVEIQVALTAGAGGRVLLLEGTYNCIANLLVPANTTLEGQGLGTILNFAGVAISQAITINGNNASVKNLKAVLTAGAGAGGTRPNVIYAASKTLLWLVNLWIIGDTSVADDASATRQNGIYFDHAQDSFIIACRVEDNKRSGIRLWGGHYLIIEGNTCQGNTAAGIYIYESTYNTVTGNACFGNAAGIILNNLAWHNAIVGNICQGNTGGGITLASVCSFNVITGNLCQTNATGMSLEECSANSIVGNSFLGNTSGSGGLGLSNNSNYNTITGNTFEGNYLHGILISAAHHNTISGNTCVENSQTATNTQDDIYLTNSNYNNIQGNTCRAGALPKKPRYGINISNAGCNGNLVIDNDLYNDGFVTAPFNDAGTGTKLNTYKVPFSDGFDPQDSGFLIDANTEYARAWLRLPNRVVQVVRMKVYARSVAAEADKMRGEFVVYGGADNEAYNTHNGSVPDHPSTSSNFAADDVIYWTLTAAGVLALLGGDNIEVKVLHEAAGNGDCATNAYLRTVEIEYV